MLDLWSKYKRILGFGDKKAYIFTPLKMGYGSPQYLHMKEVLVREGYNVTLFENRIGDEDNESIDSVNSIFSGRDLYKAIFIASFRSFFSDALVVSGFDNPLFSLISNKTPFWRYYLEMGEWDERYKGSSSAFTSFKQFLLEKSIAKTDKVIAPQEQRLSLAKSQYPSAEGELVLNAPPIDPRSEFRDKQADDKLKVLYHGKIAKAAQSSKMLSLIRQTQRCEFVIAGGIEDESLEKEIERLDKKGLLDYRGYVDHSKLEDMRKECDVGLVTWGEDNNGDERYNSTAIKYAAPNKLFEYIKSGLAVISFYNQSLNNWNEEYNFGFVTSVEDAKNILEKLNRDDDLLNEIRKSNRELYLNKLNYDSQLEPLIKDIV